MYKLLGLCLVLVVTSCLVTREPTDLTGQDVRLTLLHTSDIHSRIFPYFQAPSRFDEEDGLLLENAPYGGAARIATIVKREREAANRSLWLDSGDAFQGAPVFNMFGGEAEVRALSESGLDAAVIGNHEFDLGTDNLFQQLDNWAEFGALAANYVWDDPVNPTERSIRDIARPYMVFDLKGLKVGVIGMANWSSMVGIFDGGNSLGLRPLEDGQVVEEYVRLLRPSVDVLILLSHLGLDEDAGLATSDEALEGVGVEDLPIEGVDVILGGHLHIVLDPPKVLTTPDPNHRAVLSHSGAFAKYVGRLDVVVRVGSDNGDPDQRSKVTAFNYENIPVDATVPSDPGVAALLEPYERQLNQEIDLQGVFAYADTGGERLARNHVSGGDSQLGNLVARAMQVRSGIEAEFALTNSLGIRTDFEAGPLTVEQMFNVFPFDNSITVIYLSGSEIQEMLDFVARRSASRGCRTQAQVSGITFDMVCNGDCPEGAFACAKNIYLGEDCRGGNPAGEVDVTRCAPVLPTGLYRAAVNDYIAQGGSGFQVLERNTSKQFTSISLRDALVDLLRQQASCDASVIDSSDSEGRSVVELWGQVACIDTALEAHDGRIRAVFE